MISKLSLTRFQGFGKTTDIPLKPLTLIFGPNASGKSSIIRSLLLARQSLVPNLRYNLNKIGFKYEGEDISLASFANVVFKHDESSSFIIELTIDKIADLFGNRVSRNRTYRSRLGILDPESVIEEIKTSWEVTNTEAVSLTNLSIKFRGIAEPLVMGFKVINQSRNDSRLSLEYEVGISDLSGLISLIDESFKSFESPEEKMMQYIFQDGPQNNWRNISDWLYTPRERKENKQEQEKNWQNEKQEVNQIIKDLKFGLANGNFIRMQSPSARRSVLAANLSLILDFHEAVISRSLRVLNHIGPLREISKRLSFEVGSTLAYEEDSQFIDVKPIENEVSEWLYLLTEGRYRLSSVTSFVGQLRWLGAVKAEILTDTRTGTPVTFEDVGVGLSQIRPILELLSKGAATRAGTLLIEQPELHLHPKMQANLIDLFIAYVSKQSANRSIIAETHSEAMLLRVQKRIREGTLDPALVQIIYVDQSPESPENNSSQGNFAFPLPLDENGDFIMPMPNSFSSLRFEDML